MSTRSVIARPAGDGFEGRYHHFDGYPEGLGAELWHLYHGEFAEDAARMVRVLIDEEPVGWSTIINADWSQSKCWPDDNLAACTVCLLPAWMHYRQYFSSSYNEHGIPPFRSDQIQQFDHELTRDRTPTGPLSYSARGEEPTELIRSDGDDEGTEWAYVIATHALFVFERRWDDCGEHMTGMFGAGGAADQASWVPVAECRWDDDEPAWGSLHALAMDREASA